MALKPRCPQCVSGLEESGAGWRCADHGRTRPLWRPDRTGYDALTEHLERAQGFPTLLPWPLAPGWRFSDFAVAEENGQVAATLTAVTGSTTADGPVDILVVSEEPGTGLGAGWAGLVHSDPGAEIGDRPATARVQLESLAVPLWPISTGPPGTESRLDEDRSVLAGEADGRWLWLVLRPASAVLLLTEQWRLTDLSGMGAHLLDLPFGGPSPAW